MYIINGVFFNEESKRFVLIQFSRNCIYKDFSSNQIFNKFNNF